MGRKIIVHVIVDTGILYVIIVEREATWPKFAMQILDRVWNLRAKWVDIRSDSEDKETINIVSNDAIFCVKATFNDSAEIGWSHCAIWSQQWSHCYNNFTAYKTEISPTSLFEVLTSNPTDIYSSTHEGIRGTLF